MSMLYHSYNMITRCYHIIEFNRKYFRKLRKDIFVYLKLFLQVRISRRISSGEIQDKLTRKEAFREMEDFKSSRHEEVCVF